MRAEVRRPAFVVGPERRLVLVHPDLFQDDLFLRRKVVDAERGPEKIAQQAHGALDLLGQHRGIENGAFLGGASVVIGAHLVELTIHVVGRTGRRPLECHVFEKVAHARDRIRLVAGTRVHKETQRRRVGVRIALGDDFQAVLQPPATKLHGAPPAHGDRELR